MAENLKAIDETSSKGTDWEVVSLTASTYAASPGPKGFDQPEQHNDDFNKTEQEYSGEMFLSKHFIVQPDCCEIQKEQDIQHEEYTDCEKIYKQKDKIDSDDSLHGSQFLDKEQALFDHDLSVGDGKGVESQKMVENYQEFCLSPKFSIFHDEGDVNQSLLHREDTNIAEPDLSDKEKSDYHYGHAKQSKANDINEKKESDGSLEPWWKKQAMSIFNQAKGRNTFFSLFVAVAVAGLVFLGQRWRREKVQLQQLKMKISYNDKKISGMAGPISRFKDVLISGQQRRMSMRELHPSV